MWIFAVNEDVGYFLHARLWRPHSFLAAISYFTYTEDSVTVRTIKTCHMIPQMQPVCSRICDYESCLFQIPIRVAFHPGIRGVTSTCHRAVCYLHTDFCHHASEDCEDDSITVRSNGQLLFDAIIIARAAASAVGKLDLGPCAARHGRHTRLQFHRSRFPVSLYPWIICYGYGSVSQQLDTYSLASTKHGRIKIQ